MRGKRTPYSGLWIATKDHTCNQLEYVQPADQSKFACNALDPEQATNAMCPEPYIATRVAFLHASLFSPVISTMCEAIDAGALKTFPGNVTSK